jgi:uncharacterized membrane protein
MTDTRAFANRFLIRAVTIYVLGLLVGLFATMIHPILGWVVGLVVLVVLVYALFDAMDGLIVERITEYDRFDQLSAAGLGDDDGRSEAGS